MSKFIFGCMNIGNEKDSTINLIESIESSGLIICEDFKKFKNFIEKLSIKTNASFHEWNLDIEYKSVQSNNFIIENKKNVEEKIKKTFYDKKNILVISDEGSSLLLDPGTYFLDFCLDNSIDYEIMPGPSAVIQSFLHNKIFNDYCAEFYFGGWFSNMNDSKKNKTLNLIKEISCPSILFLWGKTFKDDIYFIIKNKINNSSTLCIDLTTKKEFVLTDNLSSIYDKIIKKEIKVDNNSLISLVIN